MDGSQQDGIYNKAVRERKIPDYVFIGFVEIHSLGYKRKLFLEVHTLFLFVMACDDLLVGQIWYMVQV